MLSLHTVEESIMLLARYALAIIDSERVCARRYIEQVREQVREQMRDGMGGLAAAQVGERAERLIAFAETRQRVRLDNCLLPALRAATASAGAGRSPVQELEQLAQQGGAMLPALRSCLRQPGDAALPACLDAYCSNLALRLECEEAKLLPLACHCLSAEDWFHVGAAFLRHDQEAVVSNYGISAKLH
jgi:hypothetical protein